MKTNILLRLFLIYCLLLVLPAISLSQDTAEFAFSYGVVNPSDKKLVPSGVDASFNTNTAIHIDISGRIMRHKESALMWESVINFGTYGKINSTAAEIPTDYSTLFITPGIKYKILTRSIISPYVASGIGYGRYSFLGGTSDNNKATNHHAFNYGGGVDINIHERMAIRFEARDFMTGNPGTGINYQSSVHHNLFIGYGYVVRF